MGSFRQTARDALVFFPDEGSTQIQIIHQPPRNATTPVTYSFRASPVRVSGSTRRKVPLSSTCECPGDCD